VDLKSLEVLIEAGKAVDYVYFPVTAVISVVRGVSDGTYIETGTIGREGFAGLSVLLGTKLSPHRLEVQVAGTCLRISSPAFAETIGNSAAFRAAAGKFIASLFDQTGQSVICSSRHGIPQRCARWLLMAHDRFGSDTFLLTHTTLARMLDVRRAGVTVAALVLRKGGLIDYTRGQVTVLDRGGLEAAACECYAINRAYLHELYADLAGG
jgi:CRP-like cAMP-binding protein